MYFLGGSTLLVALSLAKHPYLTSILGGNISDAADDLAEVLGATFTLKDWHAFKLLLVGRHTF